MRTNMLARSTERVALPRRLVQRRPATYVDQMRDMIHEKPTARFCRGDMLEFEDNDGRRRFFTIIGIDASGAVDGLVYDGRPHYLPTTLATLSKLRVVKVDRMGPGDVGMYRRLLKLDPEIEEVAA